MILVRYNQNSNIIRIFFKVDKFNLLRILLYTIIHLKLIVIKLFNFFKEIIYFYL
jgi:hypothetical protein